MIIKEEIRLENFEAWSGAERTLNRLIKEGLCEDLEYVLDDLYPNGLTDTELNDILWFESDWCYEAVGLRNESEINEEINILEEELYSLEYDLDSLKEEFENEAKEENMDEEEEKNLWESEYADAYSRLESSYFDLQDKLEELKEELNEL